MRVPLLRLVGCYRDGRADYLRKALGANGREWRRIPTGSLKGCVQLMVGPGPRSVYLIRPTFVLEFVVIARRAWKEPC